MKIKAILATAALLGVFATAAHAATFAKSSSFEAPMPAKIVTPTELPSAYRGSTVTLRLKLDATGHPSEVRVQGNHDKRLVRQLTQAVSQWQFTPARSNGVAVDVEVEMPLLLTEL